MTYGEEFLEVANMKPPRDNFIRLAAFSISSFINPKVFNKKGSGIPNEEVRVMLKEMNRREFLKTSVGANLCRNVFEKA